MQKLYQCLIAPKTEIEAMCNNNQLIFKNQYLIQPAFYGFLEDYLQVPIVSIRESRNDIIILYAAGTIREKTPYTKRTVILEGPLDYVQAALTDIIEERTKVVPGITPSIITQDYIFNMDIQSKLELRKWLKKTYNIDI